MPLQAKTGNRNTPKRFPSALMRIGAPWYVKVPDPPMSFRPNFEIMMEIYMFPRFLATGSHLVLGWVHVAMCRCWQLPTSLGWQELTHGTARLIWPKSVISDISYISGVHRLGTLTVAYTLYPDTGIQQCS